jgi:hypothetical protein
MASRHVFLLLLAILVGILLVLLNSTASATTVTSPSGTTYTGTIKAESEGAIELHGPFTTVRCNKSSIEGEVEKHGAGVTAGGNVSALTYSECNFPVTVLKNGALEVHNISGTSNGTLTSSGAEITIATSIGNCIFTTTSTDIGTLTDSSTTGGNATLDTGGFSIPRTGHTFFCGSSGQLTGNYNVTTPSTLYLSHASSSPLTSPAGTPYTSTIKAESEGSIVLKGPYTDVACKSTIEGKVESHTSAVASGKVSALTFKECNFPVKVLKTGSLELHVGSGTLTSSGAELTVETSLANCVFSTSGTDIGLLTGTGVTGTNATLDILGASIPRTEHSFLCGSTGNLNGSYKITTPSTLYLD